MSDASPPPSLVDRALAALAPHEVHRPAVERTLNGLLDVSATRHDVEVLVEWFEHLARGRQNLLTATSDLQQSLLLERYGPVSRG